MHATASMPRDLAKRLPQIRLDDLTSAFDDATSALSEGRIGNLDLHDLSLPDVSDLPSVNLPDIDVRGAIAALTPARMRRDRSRRPRILGALGLATVALAGWAILANAPLRQAIADAVRSARSRLMGLMSSGVEHDTHPEPIAFPTAATAPQQAPEFGESADEGPEAYPVGLGSDGATARA